MNRKLTEMAINGFKESIARYKNERDLLDVMIDAAESMVEDLEKQLADNNDEG